AADPARASIAPGETANLTWILAEPSPIAPHAWSAVACLPPDGTNAAPACAGELAASLSGSASGDRVTMGIAVPPSLGDAPELLVLAAFCDGGVSLDAASFTATCASGDAILASVRVRLAGAGANANPAAPSPVKLGDDVLADSAVGAGAP